MHGKQNGDVPVTRFTSLGSLKKLGKSHLLGGFIYTPTGLLGCPGSSAIKESACSAKDPGSVPGELFPWRRDRLPTPVFLGFPGGSDGKESTSSVEDLGSILGLGRSPGQGHGNTLHYSYLETSHGQRSMVGFSPWGCNESDMTQHSTALVS